MPATYWLAVVLVSIVGTLIADHRASWRDLPRLVARGETLSIHTVVTGRREAFHWLAILLTFASCAGDLETGHIRHAQTLVRADDTRSSSRPC